MSLDIVQFLFDNGGSIGSVIVLMVFLNKKIDKVIQCMGEFKLHISQRVSRLEAKHE